MYDQRLIEDAPTPIARRLGTTALDEGYDLYEEWKLECYDPDDFASWLDAYRRFPNRDQEGSIQLPTLLPFCGEADRSECMKERLAGRCRLSDAEFAFADQMASTEEFRQSWEYVDLAISNGI